MFTNLLDREEHEIGWIARHRPDLFEARLEALQEANPRAMIIDLFNFLKKLFSKKTK